MKAWGNAVAIFIYQIGAFATLGYLFWQDGAHLSWWKYPLLFALNCFIAEIWPVYWIILRPLFG